MINPPPLSKKRIQKTVDRRQNEEQKQKTNHEQGPLRQDLQDQKKSFTFVLKSTNPENPVNPV